MPRVCRAQSPDLKLECDSSHDSFIVSHTSQGEPFRSGIEIGIENNDFNKSVIVVLEDGDAIALRDYLINLYPGSP